MGWQLRSRPPTPVPWAEPANPKKLKPNHDAPTRPPTPRPDSSMPRGTPGRLAGTGLSRVPSRTELRLASAAQRFGGGAPDNNDSTSRKKGKAQSMASPPPSMESLIPDNTSFVQQQPPSPAQSMAAGSSSSSTAPFPCVSPEKKASSSRCGSQQRQQSHPPQSKEERTPGTVTLSDILYRRATGNSDPSTFTSRAITLGAEQEERFRTKLRNSRERGKAKALQCNSAKEPPLLTQSLQIMGTDLIVDSVNMDSKS